MLSYNSSQRTSAISEQGLHPFQRAGECLHGAEEIMGSWADKDQPARNQTSQLVFQEKVKTKNLTSLWRLNYSEEQHR